MCDYVSVGTTAECCDALKIMSPVETQRKKKLKEVKPVTLNDIQSGTVDNTPLLELLKDEQKTVYVQLFWCQSFFKHKYQTFVCHFW